MSLIITRYSGNKMRIIKQLKKKEKRRIILLSEEDVFAFFRNVDLRELLPEYRIEPSALTESPSTTYDLISNVVHDGEPGKN